MAVLPALTEREHGTYNEMFVIHTLSYREYGVDLEMVNDMGSNFKRIAH
jgi:hypothetical protein